MKKLLALLLLLACPAIYAQINYEPGYFTDNGGNKTTCLIKNLAWKNNPLTFEYRLSENGETKEALLKDVAAFEVSGYKFTRFTVKMDKSDNNIQNLTSLKTFVPETTTVYLKTLVEGPVNLYSYEQGNLIKYFISTASTIQPQQLLYKKYVIDSAMMENNYYQQQLLLLMRDADYGVSVFEKLEYNKESLTKIILRYNTDKGTVTDLTKKQNKGSFNVKVTAGVSMASLKTTQAIYRNTTINGAYYEKTDYNFGTAAVPGIGFEAECILPFNNNKWSIFVNPSVQFYKKSEDIAASPGNAITSSTWSLKYTFLEIPVGFRHYMFLNNSSKIYLEAAYTLAPLLGKTALKNRGNVAYDVSPSSGFALGAGFTYKGTASIGLRYHAAREIIQYNIPSIKYSSIGLILGYKIF